MPVFKKKKSDKSPAIPDPCDGPVKTLDKRVGLSCYRDFFTLKNFWKTVRRNAQDCGKTMFSEFLKTHPEHRDKYGKLKNAPDEITAQCSDAGFEALSAEYLKIFDDVISAIEESPEDCSSAIKRLQEIGKVHGSKTNINAEDFNGMEQPFLKMASSVLEDRFNEKCENLFRLFFKFCVKHITEGFS